MERRHFLKIAFGFAAGAVAVTSATKFAEAAPLAPQSPMPQTTPDSSSEPQPALATQNDLDKVRVEKVRWHWHRRRHWGWHRRRYWGHRRRHHRRWHW